MALIFLSLAFGLGAIVLKLKKFSLMFWAFSMIGIWFLLWFHATEHLNIQL